jgi:hypothetical protein
MSGVSQQPPLERWRVLEFEVEPFRNQVAPIGMQLEHRVDEYMSNNVLQIALRNIAKW